MKDTLDLPVAHGKTYKDKAFWLGTFLGGPLVAGYLWAENFKAIGEHEKAKPTWIIAVLVTIVIFGGVFFIPDTVNIPNQLIPIAYTAIAFGIFKIFQEEKVKEHIDNGGAIFGWGRVILVGIIGLFVTTVPVYALVYATDAAQESIISYKTYGLMAKHEIAYDNTTISEIELDNIARGFSEIGFFGMYEAQYVYVEKDGPLYQISISVLQGTENNTEAIAYFSLLRNQIDDHLKSNNVEILLVVEYLDNVVKVLK